MKYYLYVFLDEKNKPYYVGKTNDFKRRKKEHLAAIRNGDPLPKYKKARYLKKKGIPFKMKAVARFLYERDALESEKTLIRTYRKRGLRLFNLTEGGDSKKKIKIPPYKPKNKKRIKRKLIR